MTPFTKAIFPVKGSGVDVAVATEVVVLTGITAETGAAVDPKEEHPAINKTASPMRILNAFEVLSLIMVVISLLGKIDHHTWRRQTRNNCHGSVPLHKYRNDQARYFQL